MRTGVPAMSQHMRPLLADKCLGAIINGWLDDGWVVDGGINGWTERVV